MVNGIVTTVLGGALLLAFSGNGIAGSTTATSKIALATADRERLFREFQVRLTNNEQIFREFLARLTPPVELPQPPHNLGEIRVASANPSQMFADFETWMRGPVPAEKLIRLAAAGQDFADTPGLEKTVLVRPMVPVKQPDCVLPIAATEPPVGSKKHFEIGDKLKIAFFENLKDAEKNKYGNAAGTEFEQHPELSGEYIVQDDGTVSVPILGSFDVTDLSPKELQTVMVAAFDKALGSKGFVTIVSIERPPIYVLGPVKTPGSYTYSPGMTVLHAVTLAGGFPRQDEPWQKMEKIRETAKRYGTLESLSEFLTRQAVLKSERDRGNPTLPPQLIELVGPTKAAALISVEVDRRSGIVAARRAQLQSAAEAVQIAQQEVDQLSGKNRSIDAMDANLQALKKHADALIDLNRKGVIANYQVSDARTHLADAERNRQDILNQLAQAKGHLATAQQNQATLEASTRGELDTQILSLNQQIADASRANMTSEGILGTLQVQYETPPASAITYEIVRQTTRGPVTFVANGMSTLIPGDLVQVSTTSDAVPPGQPNSRPATTTPATITGCR